MLTTLLAEGGPGWVVAGLFGWVARAVAEFRSVNEAGGRRAGLDVEHDHCALGVVDLVEHAPVPAEPGTVDAGKLRTEGAADSLGVGQQGAGDELDGNGRDLRRQPIGEAAAGRGRGSQLVRVGHVARRPFTSVRTASVP